MGISLELIAICVIVSIGVHGLSLPHYRNFLDSRGMVYIGTLSYSLYVYNMLVLDPGTVRWGRLKN
ncbi:hypothetical protein [Rosistilla oblonga]|uniref:hypothetical protein n=1 Tax=Rosistilla oblonga TaxID=2527990 RepID=UPI001E4AA55F|nr:hypothetical protein [Rosistilla oblonga]